MRIPEISLEVWRKLYDASLAFLNLRPWGSLFDSDLFGVTDPITGQIGYCSVMGALGQVLALCVYRGTEGLGVLRRIQTGQHREPEDLIGMHNCLLAEFEDRAALKKEDLAVIRALGLKFRGRKAYPVFRSYLPGYYPWFLTEHEARFLALALDAACEFVTLFRQDPRILQQRRDDGYLVYTRQGEAEDARAWTTAWLTPDPLPESTDEPPPIPEELLRKVLSSDLKRVRAWEAGCFLMSFIRIQDRERPYYPRSLMVVDHLSGIVLGAKLVPAFEDESLALRDFVVSSVRDLLMLPVEIRVGARAHHKALMPLAALLEFRLTLREELPSLQEAQQSYEGYMRRGI